MKLNNYLRLIAGIMVLLSIVLTVTVSIHWLWFTAFIGVNLAQSAFTNWCPMITFLRKLGVQE